MSTASMLEHPSSIISFQPWIALVLPSTPVLIGIAVALVAAIVVLLYVRSRGAKSGESAPQSPIPAPASHATVIERRATPTQARQRVHKPATPVDHSAFDISDLPVSRMESISMPGMLEQLADVQDEGLLAAIESVQDDEDADSEMRLVALRVLGGFRSRNSVEALSQLALYDLSTNLRVKAVGMLADFDHQSVFETIVLSCADPSREVRAAAARALVKVTFDRGDEWARIALDEDQYMARQVARAAVEAGLVERSFDRLTLKDEKAVYEAFALVYLLIQTGETERIYNAMREHRDAKIRMALVQILKVVNVPEAIPHLSALIAAEPMSSPLAEKAREVALGFTAKSSAGSQQPTLHY